MKEIKVLIADDIKQTRENIRLLLELDSSIQVVGEAADGEQTLELAGMTSPDVVLMDINMPVMDGIKATELLNIRYPRIAVIVISVQGEQEYLKKAMMAGAREYMIKPFTADELISTIKRVAEINSKRWEAQQQVPQTATIPTHKPQAISLFSAKGGAGKTSIAVNLAVALAERTGERVALVDLDLQFGDVAVLMNIHPKRTIAELMQENVDLDRELLESYLYQRNGVHVLAAPNKPELAELVNEEGVTRTLQALASFHDYIVIDTPPVFNDMTLAAFDQSDSILMVLTPDLPSLKDNKRALDLAKTLSLQPKIKLVLNRSGGGFGIEESDVERSMEMKISASFPNDAKLVMTAMNRGVPFVIMDPNAPMSRSMQSLLPLVGRLENAAVKAEGTSKRGGFFSRRRERLALLER
ncbi:MAG: AAA family ATPase [Syntrophomonadales bacterium]|jgi:pilus assembly protein CpaE